MQFTDRQRYLLRACVEAELDNNRQCDTPLSLEVTEEADDPDAAGEQLRQELRDLLAALN